MLEFDLQKERNELMNTSLKTIDDPMCLLIVGLGKSGVEPNSILKMADAMIAILERNRNETINMVEKSFDNLYRDIDNFKDRNINMVKNKLYKHSCDLKINLHYSVDNFKQNTYKTVDNFKQNTYKTVDNFKQIKYNKFNINPEIPDIPKPREPIDLSLSFIFKLKERWWKRTILPHKFINNVELWNADDIITIGKLTYKFVKFTNDGRTILKGRVPNESKIIILSKLNGNIINVTANMRLENVLNYDYNDMLTVLRENN